MPIERLTCPTLTSLTGMHYYGGAYSNSCMRVALMMEEKGIEWQTHAVNMLSSENMKSPFSQISPRGTVPAIVHNGWAVSDSFFILKYLEEQFPEPCLLPPKAGDREAMWDSVRRACDCHIDYIKSYFYAVAGGRPCSKADLEWYRLNNPPLCDFHTKYQGGMTSQQKAEVVHRVSGLCSQLDAELNGTDFLMGDHYTLADVAWVSNFLFLEVLNFDLTPYPHLNAWMARIKSRPSHNRRTRIPRMPLWFIKGALQLKRATLWRKG